MISKRIRDGRFILECDVCGDAALEDFESFHDAVDFKNDTDNGWKGTYNEDTRHWSELCPECCSKDTEDD